MFDIWFFAVAYRVVNNGTELTYESTLLIVDTVLDNVNDAASRWWVTHKQDRVRFYRYSDDDRLDAILDSGRKGDVFNSLNYGRFSKPDLRLQVLKAMRHICNRVESTPRDDETVNLDDMRNL